MLGRKRRSAHAPVVLDEIDQRRERPALQIAVPHAGHRKPRALDRKHHRDDVADRIRGHGVRHHRPVRLPIFPVVQNPAKNQQICEVREIDGLHEVVAKRCRELLEPDGRMHAGQPEIESDQLRVLPRRHDEMNEMREFLEAEQKEKMRIPVPPEMPELLGERRWIHVVGNQNVHAAAQKKNQRYNTRARRKQPHRMRKIFGE